LTGRLASRNPHILGETPSNQQINIRWNTPLLPEESSLVKSLNELGYATGMSGKWHNGAPGNIIGDWPEEAPSVYAENVGPESALDSLDVRVAIETAHNVLVNYLEGPIGFDWAKTVSYENKERWTVPHELQVHNLEWITGGALDFLERYQNEPFFLYVSLPVPHGHYYQGWEDDNILATPHGYLNEIPESQRSRASVFDRLANLGIDRRNSMGTWIDDSVGAILDKLDALELSENTLVVFTSDHQARGKNTCYEGTRVPMIVRWPGIVRPGMHVDALAANTDFTPTLVKIAGGNTNPEQDDGESLLPLLMETQDSIHDYVFLEMNNSRAVVTDEWKLLLNRVPSYQEVVNPQVWERGPESIASAMTFDQKQAEKENRPRRVGWDGIIANGPWETIGVWFYSAATFPAYFERNQLYNLETDPFEQENVYDNDDLAMIREGLMEKLAGQIRLLPRPFGEFPSAIGEANPVAR
jgi:arylsulfatase A-like enzyme